MNEQKNILALDPATNCGWAHSTGPCGTWNLAVRTDESKGMRLLRMRGKLNEIHSTVGVDILVYEAARHAASNRALVVQSEIQGVIKLWCEDMGIEYRGFSPTEIKKHATGKGNASKPQMLSAAKSKWSKLEIPDDNTADALWILDLAQLQLK